MKNSLYKINVPYGQKAFFCRKAFIIRGDLLHFLAVTYRDDNGQAGGWAWVKYSNSVVQVFRTKMDTDAALEQKLEKMSKAIADFYGYEFEGLDLNERDDDFVLKSFLVSEMNRAAIRLN